MLSFVSDGGYQVRRALASRPRRRYTLEYLGKNVQEMHYLRDFLMFHRNGITPFSFIHMTAYDIVSPTNTTPVWLQYQHGLVTGQWVNISAGPSSLVGQWQVTRIDSINLVLNGSVAAGLTPVNVEVYLPNAVARFNDNTWESPAKIVGTERLGGARADSIGALPGFFSWSISVEEVF
jgi:hypothetical protein